MKTTFLFALVTMLLTISVVFAQQDTTLTITDAGKVLIGTTTSSGALRVEVHNPYPNGAAIAGYDYQGSSSAVAITGYSNSFAAIQGIGYNAKYAGAFFGTVYIDRKLGIGVTRPSNAITLPNDANSNGQGLANAWLTYSSRRWKTNIKTYENALQKVQQLRGVTYYEKSSGKHSIGLIAEEVGEVIPEVVTYEANGKDAQSIDYPRLVAVLIQAIKEQQKQIEELKNAINSSTASR